MTAAPLTDVVTRFVIEDPQYSDRFISIINDEGGHAVFSHGGKYYPISIHRALQVLLNNIEYIKEGEELFTVDESLLAARTNVQEAHRDHSMRCLVFRDGTKIAYPKDIPTYKRYTQLTINDSGQLCLGMTGESFVCIVDEV